MELPPEHLKRVVTMKIALWQRKVLAHEQALNRLRTEVAKVERWLWEDGRKLKELQQKLRELENEGTAQGLQ